MASNHITIANVAARSEHALKRIKHSVASVRSTMMPKRQRDGPLTTSDSKGQITSTAPPKFENFGGRKVTFDRKDDEIASLRRNACEINRTNRTDSAVDLGNTKAQSSHGQHATISRKRTVLHTGRFEFTPVTPVEVITPQPPTPVIRPVVLDAGLIPSLCLNEPFHGTSEPESPAWSAASSVTTLVEGRCSDRSSVKRAASCASTSSLGHMTVLEPVEIPEDCGFLRPRGVLLMDGETVFLGPQQLEPFVVPRDMSGLSHATDEEPAAKRQYRASKFVEDTSDWPKLL